MSASLIGRLGSSTFRPSAAAVSMSLTGSCFSSESAPGPFHHGIRIRGGTIFWAALPLAVGRSKRTCELTSSIVPRGTSFHRWVDAGRARPRPVFLQPPAHLRFRLDSSDFSFLKCPCRCVSVPALGWELLHDVEVFYRSTRSIG